MTCRFLGGALLVSGVLSAASLSGQDVGIETLSTTTAVSSTGFTRVEGVRELSDGRVIVVDRNERFVYLLAEDLSPLGTVGGRGQGPGEYMLPGRIIALDGDSTAVFDGGRGRFLTIRPDGTPGEFRGAVGDLATSRARAGDAQGRLYAQGAPIARTPTGSFILADSAAIERWMPGVERRDTVAYVPVVVRPDQEVDPSTGVLSGGPPSPPFSGGPDWAVAQDGTLGIVHSEPYRVDMVSPAGTRQVGPQVPFDPIPVSEAHREEWRAERSRPQPALAGAIGQPDAAPRIVMSAFPVREPDNWPETLPAFVPPAATFAPDAALWVQRTVAGGSAPLFDVFYQTGTRRTRVSLPEGSRLVGLGDGSVYVVWKDELELEWLWRLARD